MKIVDASELSSIIRDDLGWRRKELVVFRSIVDSAQSSKEQAVLRGAIAVLYAHWEGFVKTAAQRYVDFVKSRRLRLCDLSPNFAALAARKKLFLAKDTTKAKPQIDFVEWILSEWNSRAHLPGGEIITTSSNLNPEVFRNIIDIIGLQYRPEFSIAEKPVIQRLVEIRNSLAHGEWQIVDSSEFTKLYLGIDTLMVLFCNDVDAAASLGQYKRPAVDFRRA